jgi:tRNA-dihydrouridine synthase
VADRAAFAKALVGSRAPVCYNGDLTTAAQIAALEQEYPQVSAVMVGRGVIADPALLRKACGGAAADKETLHTFMDTLYRNYAEAFGGEKSAINRMKGVWFYVMNLFDKHDKLEKQLKKLHEPWEYEVTVEQIFAQLPLRQDAAE